MRRIQLKCLGVAFSIFLAGCKTTSNSVSSIGEINTNDLPQSLQPFIENATYSYTEKKTRDGSQVTETSVTLTLINGQTVEITKDSSSGIESSLNSLSAQNQTGIAGNLANNILNSIGLVPPTSCD
jgi:hypothetical protein